MELPPTRPSARGRAERSTAVGLLVGVFAYTAFHSVGLAIGAALGSWLLAAVLPASDGSDQAQGADRPEWY